MLAEEGRHATTVPFSSSLCHRPNHRPNTRNQAPFCQKTLVRWRWLLNLSSRFYPPPADAPSTALFSTCSIVLCRCTTNCYKRTNNHEQPQTTNHLQESEKNRKLNDLLDALDFNQVVIFVSKVARANELDRLLQECNFPSVCIHSGMTQDERITRYKDFKARGYADNTRGYLASERARARTDQLEVQAY